MLLGNLMVKKSLFYDQFFIHLISMIFEETKSMSSKSKYGTLYYFYLSSNLTHIEQSKISLNKH